MSEQKAKILVVDDDLRLRDLLQRYLTEQGFLVTTVSDAPGMDKLLAKERFDLLVLDIMMPGEDGLAACRRLRGTKNERRDREVPLVLPVCQALVEQAFQWGEGSGRKLLRPWTKNWRDLDDVATRLQIAPFSLHSLRHTFATWHLAAGISWDDTAHALGHADTTMLHRTYGHLGGVELRRRLLRTLREGAKTSPDVPRHGARGALPAHAARSPQNDESPSFEGLSGYRRSELNQRPWDYDSPALTD